MNAALDAQKFDTNVLAPAGPASAGAVMKIGTGRTSRFHRGLRTAGIAAWGNPVAVGLASRCIPLNYSIGGGVKPPNSRSIIPANAIVVWSFR